MSSPVENRQSDHRSLAHRRQRLVRGVMPLVLCLLLLLLWEGQGATPNDLPGAVVSAATEEVLNLTAQRDTWVDEANPGANYGNGAAVYIRRDSEGREAHALLYFDTSALPDNAVILSATLETYSVFNFQEPQVTDDVAPIQAEAILSNWAEFSATWNNRPTSTYLNDPPVVYQQEWLSYDVSNIVQAWADGTAPNYGIKLVPGVGDTLSAFFLDRNQGGIAPRLTISYEEAPPPCTPLEGVTIGGPTLGQTGVVYDFDAAVRPANASTPLSYSWSASAQPASSEASPAYGWQTTGTKTVSLTVENCGGSVADTHTVQIETPDAACDAPLSELTLHGPTRGTTSRPYGFSAVAGPADASAPVTFTWQASGQSGGGDSGAGYSERTWSWSSTGSKQIAVTAENCGGSITRNLTIDIVERPVLPDLTLGTPWYDAYEGTIGFIVRNEGQDVAPAGHSVGQYTNLGPVTSATVNEPIPGGGVRAGQFATPWSCGYSQVRMTLVADDGDAVEEGDESNNEYSDIWPCDLRAPALVSGPTVAGVTAVSAQIEWEADEASSSWLEYGLTGYATQRVDGSGTGTAHSVSLSGLQPATTYRMRVFIEDDAGNLNNSPWVTFETNTPGVDAPAITTLNTDYLEDHDYDTYVLAALVDNAAYVDRVEFYLDGMAVSADYSGAGVLYAVYLSPPQLGFDPANFFENAHTFEARVYDTAGRSNVRSMSWEPEARPAPVALRFVNPADGEEVEIDGARAPSGTMLPVDVWAAETDWKCSWGATTPNSTGLDPVDCADANAQPVERLRLFRNGFPRGRIDDPNGLTQTFAQDIGNVALGRHTLRVDALASDGTLAVVEQDFRVVRGEANFSYERTVTRQDNVFQISLTITNVGNATARVERVRDTLYGFQVEHRDHLPGFAPPEVMAPQGTADVGAWYTVRTTHTGYHSTVLDIDVSSAAGDYARVPPGESMTVFYHAVPILYRTPPDVYRIGAKAGDIFHFVSYREDFEPSPLWTDAFYAVSALVEDAELGGSATLHQSVMAAVAEADYLIITSPYGLSVHASNVSWRGTDAATEREGLYSDMAELARLADGVIAYYSGPYAFDLDDLLEPGGYWYESMHPDFRQTLQGYVLIIGEHEVVPTMGGGYDVQWSDLRYASTHGDGRPELVLGRIIGNDVATMRQPLDAAIRYHRGSNVYDHSHALLYSGREEGESAFWSAIQAIDGRLPASTVVTSVRSEAINTSQEAGAFLNNTAGRDIIVYRGHGYEDGDGLAISDETGINPAAINSLNGFGNTRPFMLALACSVGDYEAEDDFGFAEASLREGVSVFIGANSLSYRYRNNEAARWFFNRFNANLSVGDVFYDLLRDKFHEWSWGDDVSNDTDWGRWAYQYQLYGDPKFGRLNQSFDDAATPMSLELPGSERLELDLGALDIVEDEGWHIVSLPDGGQMQGAGALMVPVQQVIARYPAGVRVQDVQLDARSGLQVMSELNIPVSVFRQDAQGVMNQQYRPFSLSEAAAADAWYPQREQPFEWRVVENGDGSSELLLTIYPFYYQPQTTDARYYRTWVFDVTTIETDLRAGRVQLESNVVGLGDAVQATLRLENEGAAQDVVVQTTIRTLQGVEVAGLPLRTLHDVSGAARFDLVWESDGVAAGDYMLDIMLLDGAGNHLDSAQAWVTVGRMEAQAVALETGAYPGSGGGVPLALTVRNSGDTALDGTMHLRVEAVESGEVLATFSEAVSALQAGGMREMEVVWDDGAAPYGEYRVVGYMRYNGTVSNTLVEVLGERVYLPYFGR